MYFYRDRAVQSKAATIQGLPAIVAAVDPLSLGPRIPVKDIHTYIHAPEAVSTRLLACAWCYAWIHPIASSNKSG